MSEIRLEDININSLNETHLDSKSDHAANSLPQSSTSKVAVGAVAAENGQPSNSQNVQKAKDRTDKATDKELANLASIILNEKEPASKLKFTSATAERRA